MRRETIVIAALVTAVLVPMWYIGVQGPAPVEQVDLDESVSDIRPLDGFADTPNELSPSQVGVIVWIALFILVGAITAAHRFMARLVRPPAGTGRADGGERPDGGDAHRWLTTEDWWVVEYVPASESLAGLVVMGGLALLTVVFAGLFTAEYLSAARTQYFGTYAAGLFLSLAGLTIAYYAWFMPHVEVAEQRRHQR